VRDQRGPAKEQACVGCGSAAQEWAQIHGTDGEDPADYDAMCCSCHNKYDEHWDEATRLKVSESMKAYCAANPDRNKGNRNASGKRTPEQIERMRIARWGR